MRRGMCLAGLTAIGVIFTVAAQEARQPRPEIYGIKRVSEQLYVLINDPMSNAMETGGNTAVWVMDSGVLLVDTKIAGYGQSIIDHVAKITHLPVTTIVNTHTHYDHSGTNVEFPDTVDFVVHENTLAQMSRETCASVTNCDAFKGEGARYLPKTTYSDRHTLFSGDDRVELHHFGRGHTDGDTFVVFPSAGAMHTGDMFQRMTSGFPFIDVENGNGSALEFGATLERAMAGISGVDTVIPGHNTWVVAWNDFVAFTGFYNDMLEQVRASHAAGRSVEEAAEAYRVPAEFSLFPAPPENVRRAVGWVYDEL